jgi:phosphoglycerate kinase
VPELRDAGEGVRLQLSMAALRTIRDLDVRGRRVLVRVDYNVPLMDGKVLDDTRIRESLETIRYLRGMDAIVILLSHLGRPRGVDDALRLDPVAKRLAELLKHPVIKLDDCIGEDVEERLNECHQGEVVVLENVRFYPEEELNDERFARSLAELGDVFVNDAFGVSHRAHASVDAITRFLPSGAGFLLEREVERLSDLRSPRKPFMAVLGGSKVSDKISVITALAKRADAVLIGGAMMFTFLAALGHEVGNSLVERERIPLAKSLLKAYGRKIVLPVDVAIKSRGGNISIVPVTRIPKSAQGLDIGPRTVALFRGKCENAATVFWNGPLGLVEDKRFTKGTGGLAKALARMKSVRIVGGGDTVAVVSKLKLAKKFSHVSTGGGAALEFIEGKRLPGIVALGKK